MPPDHSYIKLSDLTQLIQGVLQEAFDRTYWVIGEVASVKPDMARQWTWFDLVEKQPGNKALEAKMSAVAWREGYARLREFERATQQKFTNGLLVMVKVTVDFHPSYGLKLTLIDIDASYTLGQLQLAREHTLQRLLNESDGQVTLVQGRYISSNQQLELPPVLQRIAVVSAAGAAGYQDFIHTLETNSHGYLFFCDPYLTAMQGEGNAGSLASRMVEIQRSGINYDVIVVIRGGGAQTDLLLFDQFEPSLAIAQAQIPVLTGIGHHKDETICDLMAHTSLKTPTMVAEFILNRNEEFEARLQELHDEILYAVQDRIQVEKNALQQKMQWMIKKPMVWIAQQKQRVEALLTRSVTASRMRVRSEQQMLKHVTTNVEGYAKNSLSRKRIGLQQYGMMIRNLHPDSLLKRGFAIIYKEGRVIASADALEEGDLFTVRLKDTLLQSTLNSKESFYGRETDL